MRAKKEHMQLFIAQ